MMKRIFLGLTAALVLAAPARAETPSKTCLAAIKTANARHRAAAVPTDCWRMGPLRLGMNLAQARTLLGAPGASQMLSLTYRRKKIPLTRLFYVYPRNLENWLKLVPSRQADFHPITLKLDFSKDVLVAVAVDHGAHITPPPCKPSAPGRGFVRKGADFPYGLHGLTLDAKLSDVEARFGKFASSNAAKDFHIYWPVPLSVTGKDTVSGFRIATGAPFESGGGTPDFQLRLDPRSCFVTGYVLTPGA
jgi:hypothetical protein